MYCSTQLAKMTQKVKKAKQKPKQLLLQTTFD